MKVLYLLSQRPELTGSGVYVTALMACAARNGVRTALLAGVPEGEPLPPVFAALPESARGVVRFGRDLPFPVVGMSDVMPYASCCWRDLSPSELERYEAVFGRELLRLADAFRPDVIHANHLWVLAALARRLLPHVPVIASCHGSDLRQFRCVPFLARHVREACSRLDAAPALSRVQAREIRELFGLPAERVPVIGAGYDATVFQRRARGAREAGPSRILYAGKMSAAKGVPWLLRACRTLAEQGVDFRLELCGAGNAEEEARCRSDIAALGERVIRHGNVPQSRLAERMRAADVFVLPSFFEGLPLVLLEALACGCRLVSTALPGVEEVFGNAPVRLIRRVELPRLVHVDTPFPEDEAPFCAALAAALRAQCETDKTADAGEGEADEERDRLSAEYTWDAVFARMRAVYAHAVQTHAGRRPE